MSLVTLREGWGGEEKGRGVGGWGVATGRCSASAYPCCVAQIDMAPSRSDAASGMIPLDR